eukprot:gene24352-6213_t
MHAPRLHRPRAHRRPAAAGGGERVEGVPGGARKLQFLHFVPPPPPAARAGEENRTAEHRLVAGEARKEQGLADQEVQRLEQGLAEEKRDAELTEEAREAQRRGLLEEERKAQQAR